MYSIITTSLSQGTGPVKSEAPPLLRPSPPPLLATLRPEIASSLQAAHEISVLRTALATTSANTFNLGMDEPVGCDFGS